MKWLVWQFDIFIYWMFYKRWEKYIIERKDIRDLFHQWLHTWESIHNEPAMGIGPYREGPIPRAYDAKK